VSRVLIVDWLGRGGIAHTTGAWAEALIAGQHDVIVATRPGRELDEFSAPELPVPVSGGGRFAAHAALARSAVRLIADWRPDVVVVQNFVLPPLERRVPVAAAQAGARLVYVIHDHRLHSPLAGTRAGLRSALRAADEIWTHSAFVARGVTTYAGRTARVVPHPVPPALVRHPLPPRSANTSAVRTAVHFGILKRGYKGTDRVLALAEAGVPGWQFRLLGVGAPPRASGVHSTPGFVPAADLVAEVAAADATLLPYRLASQSGAVVLAQALGAVPVASAVGGLPEQIENGIDGLLVPPGAPVAAWQEVLRRLAFDPAATAAMAQSGARRVWEGHHAFATAVATLAASTATAGSPPSKP
jgi:glycosyltransferase involved in cell wall biosynthesis